MYKSIPFCVVLLVAGCLGAPTIPDGAPKSSLHLTSSHHGAFQNNSFMMQPDESCPKSVVSSLIANFSWAGGKEKTLLIQADKPVYLLGWSSAVTGSVASSSGDGSKSIVQAYCKSLVSFVPEKDHVYNVHQENLIGGSCQVFIEDDQTKTAPADFKVLPLAESYQKLGT